MAACAQCNTSIPEGTEYILRGNKGSAPLCSNCATNMERALQAETANPNVIGAVLLGLGAAILASVVWYAIVVITRFELGIIAIAVGWLVAQGVILGSGRKRGLPLQLISVGITIVAMGVSEYLIVRHFAVESLARRGVTDIPWLLSLDVILTLIVEGIKASPLTLLFWGIAVWQAFTLLRATPVQIIKPYSASPSVPTAPKI
jgi:hypothetical protein